MSTPIKLLLCTLFPAIVLSAPHASVDAPIEARVGGAAPVPKVKSDWDKIEHGQAPASAGEPKQTTETWDPKKPADKPWPANGPALLNFENKCTSRSEEDQLIIAQELAFARDIANIGANIQPASIYYQALFSNDLKNTIGFQIQVNTKYRNVASIYTASDQKVQVRCEQKLCAPNRVAATYASLNTINLCDLWFDSFYTWRTGKAASQCKAGSPNAHKWKNLAKFKGTKSFVLLHEMTHLKYATGSLDMPPRAWDYAYGVPHCKDLAAGTRLDKRCAEDKKNGPPALCPASYSFQNAESLAFVPAGEYWSGRCEKQITVDNLDGSTDPADWDGEDVDVAG